MSCLAHILYKSAVVMRYSVMRYTSEGVVFRPALWRWTVGSWARIEKITL